MEMLAREAYPTDLTDAQWTILEPLFRKQAWRSARVR